MRDLPAHRVVFADFLEAAALADTEMVRFSNVAQDCGVSSQTVKAYYGILEDTLLGRWLPAAAELLPLRFRCPRGSPNEPIREFACRVRRLPGHRHGMELVAPGRRHVREAARSQRQSPDFGKPMDTWHGNVVALSHHPAPEVWKVT